MDHGVCAVKPTTFPELEHVLAQSGVHMRDQEDVMRKVAAIARDGPEKLLFLSDFDMTLTRYWVNGEKGFTSFNVVEKSPLMPYKYRQQAEELARKYEPILFSLDTSLAEKIEHMAKWSEGENGLLIENKFDRHFLREMVTKANIAFRDKCEQLFSDLDSSKIPLLIFSAGLGDAILEVFRQLSVLRPNMHVLSNRLIFNEAGIAIGHTQPLVHSYNKGKSPEQLAAVEPFIEGRSNVILAGDSQGDAEMADSLPHTKHVLKIGFLNYNVEDRLSAYSDIYDIVLTGDCDMTVVNSVVRAVLSPHSLAV